MADLAIDTGFILNLPHLVELGGKPDKETHRQRFLLWFQTIMKAFGTQESCQVTYEIMAAVLERLLPPQEYALIEPFLKVTQETLG